MEKKPSHAAKFVGLVKMMRDPRTVQFQVLPGADFLVTATREDAEALIELSLQEVEVTPQQLEDGTFLTVFKRPRQLTPEDVNGNKN